MHRRGSVVLEGRERLVGIADGNADLRFDDPKDTLFLDRNGDGKLTDADALAPGRPFSLRGAGYVATILERDGSVVEFRRVGKPPKTAAPKWQPTALSAPALPAKPPTESLAELSARFDKEKKLSHPQRYGTVRKIAGLFTPESFGFLHGVAKNEKEEINTRLECVRVMGHEKYRPHVQRVAPFARSSNMRVAEAGLLALHFMGWEGREALFREVLSGSTQTLAVRGAATGLTLMGKRDVVEAAVRGSGNRAVRYYAYVGLRYGKEPPSLDLLRTCARDDYALTRAQAIRDMAALSHPDAREHALLSIEFKPMSITLGYAIVEVLGREADADAVRVLLQLAPNVESRVQERILTELRGVRDPDVTALYIKSLRAKEPETRRLAAKLLAALPGRKATDALAKQAKREKDGAALEAVLESLGEHADPRSVSVLLAAARKRDPALRAAAIRALARIGPGVPQVRRFFLKLLTASMWQDRVYALDAAGAAGDLSVVPKVLANLGHKVWQVRHAAVEALGKLRPRDGVPAMIGRLGKEDIKRVRAALAHSLFVCTGMNFYDFTETWVRWWNDNHASFKVPKEIPQRKKQAPGGTVASFYGLPLDSDRVIFVVDMSGSMSAADAKSGKTRLETAVAETLAAVGRLKPRDRINVIFFETRVFSWKNKLTALSNAARTDLERFLRFQKPTGGTNLYDGLELALADKIVDTVFLLSDGAPGAGKFVSTPDILREIGRRNQTRRVAIHCVAVGMESDLLKKLAAANGGRYVRR
jgi:HEAT repeat protein